ncbi:MAG: GGDEF domain-containing protein [Chromatiales bacterium]|nr:GGDEF domain-containing protein [Chromatiales bacterium]
MAAEYDVEGLEILGATVLQLSGEELAQASGGCCGPIRLRRTESVIQELMNADPLTGVSEPAAVEQALAAEVERSRRHRHPFCLVIADLDHFKDVNDLHGYAVGDEVLKFFAVLLREHSRQSDQVARFGGEEFVLLLPDTVLESAVACAERIRQRLEWQPITPRSGRIAASFEVAMLAGDEKSDELLRRADQALPLEAGRAQPGDPGDSPGPERGAGCEQLLGNTPYSTPGPTVMPRFSDTPRSCWPSHGLDGNSLYTLAGRRAGRGAGTAGAYSGVWEDVAEALFDHHQV